MHLFAPALPRQNIMATSFSFTLLPPPDVLSLSAWLIFASMAATVWPAREQVSDKENDAPWRGLAIFVTPAVLLLIEDANFLLTLVTSFLLTFLCISVSQGISALGGPIEEAPDGEPPNKKRFDDFMAWATLMLILVALIDWSLNYCPPTARVVAHGMLLFSCCATMLLNISLLAGYISAKAVQKHQKLRLVYLYTACCSYLLSAMLIPDTDISRQAIANFGSSLFLFTAGIWALTLLRTRVRPGTARKSSVPDAPLRKRLVLVPLTLSLMAFLLASIILLHTEHPTPVPQDPRTKEKAQQPVAAHVPPKVTETPQQPPPSPAPAHAPVPQVQSRPLPTENPATAGLPKEGADEYLRLLSAIGKYKRDRTNTRFIDTGDILGSIYASELTLDQEDFSLTPMQRFEALLRTAHRNTKLQSLQKKPDNTYHVSLLVDPDWSWGNPYYVDYLLDQILSTGRRAHALRIPLGRIHIKAVAQDEDAYGFTHTHDAIQLTLTGNHIRKINWLGIGNQQMANLLQVKAKRYGKRAMIAWCLKNDNLIDSRKFCNAIPHDADSRRYLKHKLREEARESGEDVETADWSEALQTPAHVHSSGKNAARSLKSAKRLSRPSRSSAKVSKSVTRKTRPR